VKLLWKSLPFWHVEWHCFFLLELGLYVTHVLLGLAVILLGFNVGIVFRILVVAGIEDFLEGMVFSSQF
jgi:hypothetical protein